MPGHSFCGSHVQRGAIRPRAASLLLLLVLCAGWTGSTANGQPATHMESAVVYSVVYRGFEGLPQDRDTPDVTVLRWVNRRTAPGFTHWMSVADASFYPTVYASVPVWWGVAYTTDLVSTTEAMAYTAGWLATAGSTILLKRLIGRERPFVSHSDLVIRYTEAELDALGRRASMPSGHSSMSAFTATFLVLKVSNPVIRAGSALWASSVAVSRVWNGVHFPSDTVAGFALGTGLAVLTRQFD
ncbi:MAG: phosphatase PAP2 family protein [Bacteroidetes bacterium]|nr:phosphatase PAP2 family protein [Bacteroidota bacterium]